MGWSEIFFFINPNKFCVANGVMAQSVHRMTPKHVIALGIGSKTAALARPLGTIADSSLEYLND